MGFLLVKTKGHPISFFLIMNGAPKTNDKEIHYFRLLPFTRLLL